MTSNSTKSIDFLGLDFVRDPRSHRFSLREPGTDDAWTATPGEFRRRYPDGPAWEG
jgi:hypothetical protein